jgi:hypothetical protein
MEHGFFHPDRGYWQTNSEPNSDTMAMYPEGTVEIPLKPGSNFDWDGEAWTESGPLDVAPEPATEA